MEDVEVDELGTDDPTVADLPNPLRVASRHNLTRVPVRRRSWRSHVEGSVPLVFINKTLPVTRITYSGSILSSRTITLSRTDPIIHGPEYDQIKLNSGAQWLSLSKCVVKQKPLSSGTITNLRAIPLTSPELQGGVGENQISIFSSKLSRGYIKSGIVGCSRSKASDVTYPERSP